MQIRCDCKGFGLNSVRGGNHLSHDEQFFGRTVRIDVILLVLLTNLVRIGAHSAG